MSILRTSKPPSLKVGDRFGSLTIGDVIGKTENGSYLYQATCDCGKSRSVTRRSVMGRGVKNCGCFTKGQERALLRPPGETGLIQVYGRYRLAAEKRGYEFQLSREAFREITSKPCVYCGQPPIQVQPNHRTDARVEAHTQYIHNGVDRFDNDKGYTPENSVPCCKLCNAAKGALSVSEWVSWLDRLTSFRNRGAA